MSYIKIFPHTIHLNSLIESKLGKILTEDKKEATVIVLGPKEINLDEFPNVHTIYRNGIGTENIPFLEIEKRNIRLEMPSDTTKSFIYIETSTFTCSLIFKALYDGSSDFISWKKPLRTFAGNKNLLVIGQGNIGKRVANGMSPFISVDTYDVLQNKESELKKKIKEADIITLHIPGSETNFFDENLLDCMKIGASLINTARGSIVNENHLYLALLNKRKNLKAYFDVFWEEPYKGKLIELSNFHPTPHSANMSKEFIESAFDDLSSVLNYNPIHSYNYHIG